MNKTANDALSAAKTTHEAPEFDAHEIDHSTEDEVNRGFNPAGHVTGVTKGEDFKVTRDIGEGEEPDFESAAAEQDAKGTAPSENGKLHTGTGSKSPTPFWVNRDFTWSSYTDKLTGETKWNLRPNADVVNLVAAYAPGVLEDAYARLSDDDKATATAFGQSLRDLCVEGEQIDSWLENTASYAFVRDAAKNACSAVTWTQAQQEANSRKAVKLAGEHEVRAQSSGRVAAMLRLALITAAPTLKLNFKGAAWDLAKMNAFRHQKAFMNPDEEATFRGAEAEAIEGSGFKLRAAEG